MLFVLFEGYKNSFSSVSTLTSWLWSSRARQIYPEASPPEAQRVKRAVMSSRSETHENEDNPEERLLSEVQDGLVDRCIQKGFKPLVEINVSREYIQTLPHCQGTQNEHCHRPAISARTDTTEASGASRTPSNRSIFCSAMYTSPCLHSQRKQNQCYWYLHIQLAGQESCLAAKSHWPCASTPVSRSFLYQDANPYPSLPLSQAAESSTVPWPPSHPLSPHRLLKAGGSLTISHPNSPKLN